MQLNCAPGLSDSQFLALAAEIFVVGAALTQGTARLWLSVLAAAHFAVALYRV